MRRAPLVLTLLVLVVVAGIAFAQRDTSFTLIADGTSAASTTAGFQSGGKIPNVQLCGVSFDGDLVVKQGPTAAKAVAVKTVSGISALTGCTQYYQLRPASWTSITVTRTAGTYGATGELN